MIDSTQSSETSPIPPLASTEKIVDGTVHGVPESAFTLCDTHEIFPGSSGRSELIRYVQPSRISIEDMAPGSPYKFEAYVSDGILRFTIRTQSDTFTPHHHPDLFAKLLAKRALQFFRSCGTPIQALELNWITDHTANTNTIRFLHTLQRLNHQSSPVYDESGLKDVNPNLLINTVKSSSRDNLIAAIQSTWSWTLAQELGFDTIQPNNEGALLSVDPTNGHITIRLTPPQRP